MSDPLMSTRSTIDQINMSRHSFQTLSASRLLEGLHKVQDEGTGETLVKLPKAHTFSDRTIAERAINGAKLDVTFSYAVMAPVKWVADPAKLERALRKGETSVFCASETQQLQIRHVVPRLLETAQRAYDALPEKVLKGEAGLPFSRETVERRAGQTVMCGGGAHLSLARLLEHVPKRGQTPSHPFTAAEALAALKACGRYLQLEEAGGLALPLSLRLDEVEMTRNSDNGFPVGLTMEDPDAQRKVGELAAEIRQRMERSANKDQSVAWLRDNAPCVMALKGKTKTDVYQSHKVLAGQLRFYNAVGRHNVLIIQQASQPLSGVWKENMVDDWRTGVGKGLARAGADRLVESLEAQLAEKGYGWSHTGDDTIVVAKTDDGQIELFSLDCTAFDLTQHGEVSRHVHQLMGQQMRAVDEVSGALWYGLMRERDVTVSGAVVVRLKHCGASGMPLQTEVNDTLMECFLTRLFADGRTWVDKKGLDTRIVTEANKVGWKVRLEDYVCMTVKPVPRPIAWILQRRPFLYLGYYMYSAAGHDVECFIDVPRFLSGMPYLTVGYVAKEEVGVRATLALAGYALSFGVPPNSLRGVYECIRDTALEALSNQARSINPADIQTELNKYAIAGLQLTVADVAGLERALRQEPAEIWSRARSSVSAAQALSVLPMTPLGNWADEPMGELLSSMIPLRDPGLNERKNVGGQFAGLKPPKPQRIREEEEQHKKFMRAPAEDEVYRAHMIGKGLVGRAKRVSKRDKRLDVLFSDFAIDDGDDEYT